MYSDAALPNIRLWIVAGIVCALLIGSLGSQTSNLIIAVLMIQMAFSMDGLTFKVSSIKENSKPIMYAVIACFGISTVVTLLIGSLFIPQYPDIWKGWVMLAAVPCAISVVTTTLYLKGNMILGVLSTAVIYLLALVITPLITMVFLGEAVDTLRIFEYVILFILVPMLATIPLKRLHIKKSVKTMVINIMVFLMILLSLGYNRDYILSEPSVVALAAVACVVRVFVVSLIMIYVLKRYARSRDDSVVYVSMAVWKNSGLAVTLCLVLLTSAAEAVIPCVISLVVELIWFAFIIGYMDKVWPKETPDIWNG